MKSISTLALAAAIASSQAMADDGKIEISIVKAPEPVTYRMENSMAGGFGWIVHKMRNSSLSTALTGDMYRLKPKLSDALNDDVSANLKAAGVSLSDGAKVIIDPAKPWSVKWPSLNPDDKIVLYTYIESIGVASSNLSTVYEPTLYVVYCILTPEKKDDCSNWGRASFGNGETVDSETSIAATPAEKWATSDDVFLRVTELSEAYKRGITKIAPGVAARVIRYLDSRQKLADAKQ